MGARASSVAFVCLLGLLGSACPGRMVVNDRGAGASDGTRPAELSKKDKLALLDYPVKPGVPCLTGACGPNLICMANICLKMCTQPLPGCNDKVATCAANEACMFASSFTDACYPANAVLNAPCDYQQAIYCGQGLLCVKVGTAAGKCLKLCKYGCPAGTHCGKTSNNCDVCIPG